MVYLASEQAAIEIVCPDAENVRAIDGGVPFVVQLDKAAKRGGQDAEERRMPKGGHREKPGGSASAVNDKEE